MPVFQWPYSMVSATIAKMVPVRVELPMPLMALQTTSQGIEWGAISIRA